MKLQQCPSAEKLSDYNLGKLSTADLEAVADHLDSCAECTSQLDALELQADEFIERVRQPAPKDFVADDSDMRELLSRAEALLETSVTCTVATMEALEEKELMSDVTQILSKIERGEASAAEQLLPLVYDELRKLAAAKLALEKPGQTLQATALVHDAYLRLVDVEKVQHWNSRGHFFAAAAEAMRRILVESARRKQGPTRGGGRERVELDEVQDDLGETKAKEVLAVHDALDALEEDHPSAARLVKLRYFAGMTQQEAADHLGVSRTTADRYWVYAKATMFSAFKDTSP